MNVRKTELGNFEIKSCLFHFQKRAKIWGGHVHSNERRKNIATAGFCSSECASKPHMTKRCIEFNGGCYGERRLRGFHK